MSKKSKIIAGMLAGIVSIVVGLLHTNKTSNKMKKEFPADYSKGLFHTINVNNETVNCKVQISLADECKNGHHDFSMTGTFWEVGKTRSDRSMTVSGSCHDEILEHFPELAIFAELHGVDFKGSPTYAAENGYYFIRNSSKEVFLSYYPAITAEDYDVLNECINSADYCEKLASLGIFSRWESRAAEAIRLLEELSGEKVSGVLCASKPISEEKMKLHQERVISGYYTAEQTQEREKQRKEAARAEIVAEYTKEIKDATERMEIELMLFDKYGPDVMQNVLVYSTKKVGVNWKGYNLIPNDIADSIMAETLPEGWSFECKNRIK